MKNIKNEIKNSFELNIDVEKEFEEFALKNNLVDDSVLILNQFNDYKRKSLIGFITFGVILVMSLVINVISYKGDYFEYEKQILNVMNDSFLEFKEYIKLDSGDTQSYYEILISEYSENCHILNLYEYQNTSYAQVYLILNQIDGASLKQMSVEYKIETNSYEKIPLEQQSTIWELGDISNKTIEINMYENDIIFDSFSVKIQ